MRTIEYPDPPSYRVPDAPPADLVEQWFPEVLEQLDKMQRARAAAQEAKLRYESGLPAHSAYHDTGEDWRAAITTDAAAVRRKHRPEALAALIADHPVRYGTWFARTVYAAELVAQWNSSARVSITHESRQRLADETTRLEGAIAETAALAVNAANEAGPSGGAAARLRAAWARLSDLDSLGEKWRPARAALAWSSGEAWQPLNAGNWPGPTSELGRPTTIGLALALRDAELRTQLERLRPPTPQPARLSPY